MALSQRETSLNVSIILLLHLHFEAARVEGSGVCLLMDLHFFHQRGCSVGDRWRERLSGRTGMQQRRHGFIIGEGGSSCTV
jgi:hypothetical protein